MTLSRAAAVPLLLAAIVLIQPAHPQPPYVYLVPYADGWTRVVQAVNSAGLEEVNVSLLSSDVQYLSVASYGSQLSYSERGSMLTVYTGGAAEFNVTYYTPSLTSESGGVWTLEANYTGPVIVKLEAPEVLLQATPLPAQVWLPAPNSTALYFASGPVKVIYTIPVAPQAPRAKEAGYPAQIYVAAAIAAAAVVASAAVVARKRRAGRRAPELRPDDARVLELVRERGPLTESEISRQLAIPRTTVSRITRRLERAGLVKVEKAGGVNLVRAVKREEGD